MQSLLGEIKTRIELGDWELILKTGRICLLTWRLGEARRVGWSDVCVHSIFNVKFIT